MNGAPLAVAIAAVFAGACVAVGVRARFALKALGPPPELRVQEVESERRGAFVAMELLLLRFRSAARIALAAGTATGVVALASELGRSVTQASLSGAACFALGVLAAAIVAQLGHAARRDSRRFRDEWQRRVRESARAAEALEALEARRGEWTDPGAAR